ncbi:hypothetical protein ACQP3J_33840, partial [Escherichia coli]
KLLGLLKSTSIFSVADKGNTLEPPVSMRHKFPTFKQWNSIPLVESKVRTVLFHTTSSSNEQLWILFF